MIIIGCCIKKKLKNPPNNSEENTSNSNIELNESILTFEYMPGTKKKNPKAITFDTNNQNKIRIIIDSDNNMECLIKLILSCARPNAHGLI